MKYPKAQAALKTIPIILLHLVSESKISYHVFLNRVIRLVILFACGLCHKAIADGGPIVHVSPAEAKVQFELEKLKIATDSNEIVTSIPKDRWPPKVEIIVDSSGSMAQNLSHQKTKMFFLKKIMGEYLSLQWKRRATVGLRVYGGRFKNDCADNHLVLDFSYKNLARVTQAILNLVPIGMTPLHQSVIEAVKDVKDFNGPRRIVIVTDGEDTCGGDPCASAQEMRKQILDLKFYIVALGLKGESDALKKIRCIGETAIVNDEETFKDALKQIDKKLENRDNLEVLGPDPNASVFLYRVISPTKKQLVRVFYANSTVYAEPGNYEAVLNLQTPYRFKPFTIPPTKKVTLKVEGDGTIKVEFMNSSLNVEVLDKTLKVVAKGPSNSDITVPNGTYTIRIFKNPFYEDLLPNYMILPKASHNHLVKNVGLVKVATPEPVGMYVYNSKKELLGEYLTQFEIALRSGTYHLHVGEKCTFEDVIVREKGEILILECPAL